ncbi:NAD(P)-dependent oxidoreductase [Acidisoma cellulosilytica]|uniref:NAD(P)-dependent oxidoreductase n=1 Tax=Acidisoma cellulosilyticum TaxID=2802395 RepID=A0A963Z2D0_9PROT|nr:NAD(P)-dependent oxidoreductase [Acidisoma cellulosilyticum]MCB8880583.1 NAD(P)-dependent oxidoreductase [Acidisoma cellulosilyticum]
MSEGLGEQILGKHASVAEVAIKLGEMAAPLSRDEARVEADRCYFCYDAPCVEACPTGIDIPGFIGKIRTGNVRGSAVTILESNIFGGGCARVCPTEILCEEACVREAQEGKPVTIGSLQRYATDVLMATGEQPFTRAPLTGKRIAVVGAGPAGLACAHRLAMLGHDVVVFEARPKPGGLNEYGIAAYKVVDDFAQREVAFILGIGGITIEYETPLGPDLTLDHLRQAFDAVFLAIGLADPNALGVPGEDQAGVMDALGFIELLRQDPVQAAALARGNVIVIGGGNTAIDAATQVRLLGAETVTLAYRRGPEQMGATKVEQEWAQTHGVTIRHWLAPVAIEHSAVAFGRTRLDAGKLVVTDERVTLPADLVLKAVGQSFLPEPLTPASAPASFANRIGVDQTYQTSLPGVFAGGDCVSAGEDLTVQAVAHGRDAAIAINRYLST